MIPAAASTMMDALICFIKVWCASGLTKAQPNGDCNIKPCVTARCAKGTDLLWLERIGLLVMCLHNRLDKTIRRPIAMPDNIVMNHGGRIVNGPIAPDNADYGRTQGSGISVERECRIRCQIAELTNVKSTMDCDRSLTNFSQPLNKPSGNLPMNKIMRFIEPADAQAFRFGDVVSARTKVGEIHTVYFMMVRCAGGLTKAQRRGDCNLI
jgi:hypothetical protein